MSPNTTITTTRALKAPSWPSVALWILGCEAIGFTGSFWTVSTIPTWYVSLDLPSWQPPSWLFGPVWTMLYLLMGIAGARIWTNTQNGDVTRKLFVGQLFLNALWTPVFFGAHNLLGGLVLILALDCTVFALLRRLHTHDRASMALLMPYFAWILFATGLNAAILALNP